MMEAEPHRNKRMKHPPPARMEDDRSSCTSDRRGQQQEDKELQTNEEQHQHQPTKHMPPSVDLLLNNDDVLHAVLLRTTAADHNALRLTCKRFCQILNSVHFRRQRSETGWVEVHCKIPDPYEVYKTRHNHDDEDEDDEYEELVYDYDEFLVQPTLIVDGEVIMSHDGRKIKRQDQHAVLQLGLIPRCYDFHMTCDEIEGALGSLATLLFKKNGKAKVACLKSDDDEQEQEEDPFDEGSDEEDDANRAGRGVKDLLYIQDFQLPMEYRSLESTVGPRAIRSLLMHDERLRGRWSLAMYVPYGRTQYTKNDRALEEKCNSMASTMSFDDCKQRREWTARFHTLEIQDLRQMLRAGFHQVKEREVVSKAPNYYVYATPSDFDHESNNKAPILSVAEAEKIDLAERQRNEMSVEEEHFLGVVKSACAKRKQLVTKIEWLHQQTGLSENEEALVSKLEVLMPSLDLVASRQERIHEQLTAMQKRFQERSITTESEEEKTIEDLLDLGDFLVTILKEDKKFNEIFTALQKVFEPSKSEDDDDDDDGKSNNDSDDADDDLERQQPDNVDRGVMKKVLSSDPTVLNFVRENGIQKIQRLLGMNEDSIAAHRKGISTVKSLFHNLQMKSTAKIQAKNDLVAYDDETRDTLSNLVKSNAPSIIVRSDAIHVCAANCAPQYIKLFLKILLGDMYDDPSHKSEREQIMNRLDVNGLTPLMVLAHVAGTAALSVNGQYIQTCKTLIDLGADRKKRGMGRDEPGLTALEEFQSSRRSQELLGASWGIATRNDTSRDEAISAMESLLEPV